MTIIKHGYHATQEEKICSITCSCGCQFTFQKTEKLIYIKSNLFWIDCPECRNTFRISASFVIGD